jgi:hypothetical protein
VNLFLIGAGFTKAVYPDAPLNSELMKKITGKYPPCPFEVLAQRYNGTQDVEIALTRLDLDIAEAKRMSTGDADKLHKLRTDVEQGLGHHFSKYVANETLLQEKPWLRTFLEKAMIAGDVAVSLNYDCVLGGR